MLCEGEKAPSFTLQATGRRTVSLSDFRGRRSVVLFFYHQDGHPVCTAEAEAFRDLHEDFNAAGAAIVGISADYMMDHDSFARKSHLRFSLLSDEDRIVWNAYSSCRGQKHLSPNDRLTCVIDKDGIVRRIWPEVTVDGHAAEVLNYVVSMGEEQA
jgi:peroxiredoxin Q/BCP